MIKDPLSADLIHILDHTRDIWEDLRGAHIFVTGGTGFVGCWLLESFLFANQQLHLKASISILTRKPSAVRINLAHLMTDKSVTLIEGDIRNFAYPINQYSHIIHAATETRPPPDIIDPFEKFTSNIDGTRKILDFAHFSGASRLLYTSSGAIYGRQPPEMTHVQELYPGAPETTDLTAAYGQSKRASEFLCIAQANKTGMQALIARGFAFTGPRLPLNVNLAIGNFIRDALKGDPIKINGDGTPYRSYLYAADLAIWLWTILCRGKSCLPYNVGSDEGINILELARTVKEVVNPTVPIIVTQSKYSDEPPQRYVPCIDRCKSQLGLQVFIPLREGIRRTAEWYS